MSSVSAGIVLLICLLAFACKSDQQCEIGISRVIIHRGIPTRRALAEFNDSTVMFRGYRVIVAPSSEGYLIIADKGLIGVEGNDLLEFVSKRIQR